MEKKNALAEEQPGEPSAADEPWELRDAWLGLLFLFVGLLLGIYGWLLVQNDHGWILDLVATSPLLLSVFFLFIGCNAVIRSLHAGIAGRSGTD